MDDDSLDQEMISFIMISQLSIGIWKQLSHVLNHQTVSKYQKITNTYFKWDTNWSNDLLSKTITQWGLRGLTQFSVVTD